VQEVLRTLLEAYYEPKFSDASHGFRPERGCHTALLEIQRTWRGTAWFIEGDIKGCFDNIDHQILLETIRKDIHDGRLIALIDGLLRAGYMEDWKYHETASGTPQGGIISPILANIYLDRLDRFVTDTLIPANTKGRGRRDNPVYLRFRRALTRARQKGDWETVARLTRERNQYRSNDPMDPNYRRLRYVRYADDFLLGLAGTRAEAEVIRDRLEEYLGTNLKLTLSKEKTLITHAVTEKAKFLGYEITVTMGEKRNLNGNIALLMPRTVVAKYLSQFSSGDKVRHRPELEADDDYTIISRFQSVLKGLYNYYCMAINVSRRMYAIKYILETSLTKTLAHKHRIKVSQVFQKYRGINKVDNLLTIQVIVERPNKEPLIAVFGGFPIRRNPLGLGTTDFRFEDNWHAQGDHRSEIVERLLSNKCELCGATGPLDMHHIRKLKDIDKPGQRSKPRWMRVMIARRRKSLAVCERCHKDIHAGRYDGPSPDDSLESRVR
jgi:group II intron reverse transcriptase/maturase